MKLTAQQVKAITEPGKYYDRDGLILRVAPGGSKQWVWRGTVHGRRVELGMGSVRFTSLAEAREIAFAVGLDASLVPQAVQMMTGCYRVFGELDATMLEINPLAVTADRRLLALDAKMTFDDNALFRHQDVSELRDKSQEDPRERTAVDRGLSYVGLDGNIGCIINGAGLAMATLDMIKHAGGEPANFLDIGGGASPERVLKAFRLVLSDDNVEAVLVNIFAGINRRDWVAEGVVQALQQLDPSVPVVVRLSGTNVEEGRRILAEADVGVVTADSLAEAGTRAVAATERSAA